MFLNPKNKVANSDAKDEKMIRKLMIHPEYRRRGLGSALLTEIEKWYPGKRYELFTSTRSVDSIRLYRKMGYTPFRQEAVTDELVFVYFEK